MLCKFIVFHIPVSTCNVFFEANTAYSADEDQFLDYPS